MDDPRQLRPRVEQEVADRRNGILVSAATIWEIAIKVGLGKLQLSLPYLKWMERAFAVLDAQMLPVTVEYAAAQMRLPHHHGDAFDRMLAAQALADRLTLVSVDSVFDLYGASRLW